VGEEICLAGGPRPEHRDGGLNFLLRAEETERSLLSGPDSGGDQGGLQGKEPLGSEPLKESGSDVAELSGEAPGGDRSIRRKVAEEFVLSDGETLVPVLHGPAPLRGETHQAAGGSINAWRQGSLDHLSPGCAVVISDLVGEFQQAAIQEGFRIQDVLNVLELLDVGPLQQTHQVPRNDACPQGDENALAWSGHLLEVGRNGIGEGLVNR
jgi:hypothetical protein